MEDENTVDLFDNGGERTEVVTPVEPDDTEDKAEEFQVPTKFQGKSFEDVIVAYTNLEKEHGRKANEVGELRQLTDEILKQQVAQPKQAEPINDNVSDVDFFDDPDTAVKKAIDTNPRLQKLEQRLEAEAQKNTRQELLNRHKDYEEVVNSGEFVDWVKQSPGRIKMFQASHTDYDVDLADDLISTFKTTQKVAHEEARAERDAVAAEALKQASTEQGSVSDSRQPTYLRSQLIRLKIEDPARYSAMSSEIEKAYAEGRVK